MELKLKRLRHHLERSLAQQYPDGVEIICPDGILSLSNEINAGGASSQSNDIDAHIHEFEAAIDHSTSSSSSSSSSEKSTLDPTSITSMNFRGWWKELDTINRYSTLHQTLQTLAAMLRANPVDGIIGFSQGATLAIMLAALCEASTSPSRLAALASQGDPLIDIEPPQQPFKFALVSCGHKGTDEFYDGFYSPRLTTPVYFDVATLDHMIKPSLSEAWVQVSERSQVSIRNGGHWFPTSESDARAMAEFAAQCMVNDDGRAQQPSGLSGSLELTGRGRGGDGRAMIRSDSACDLKEIVGPGSRSSSSGSSSTRGRRRVLRVRKKGPSFLVLRLQ
jgi:dienelactone hydrolase